MYCVNPGNLSLYAKCDLDYPDRTQGKALFCFQQQLRRPLTDSVPLAHHMDARGFVN